MTMLHLFAAAVAATSAAAPAAVPGAELIGKPAPGFTLPDDRGGHVSLASYKGKQPVVLAFFPKAFTPGCEKEMTLMGKDFAKFQALHAQVLGISYDNAKTQHDFATHCAAAFPFLSDDGGHVATAYGDATSTFGFQHAGRRTFVVDRKGVIRFVYDGMPDDAKVLADLATLK